MFVLFLGLLLLGAWAWSRITELRQEISSLRREVERLGFRIDTLSDRAPSPTAEQLPPVVRTAHPETASKPTEVDVPAAQSRRPASGPSPVVPPVLPRTDPVSVANAEPVISPALERKLGTSWLNKLGAALLVLGVASFLTYQVRTLGPLGRDLIGLVVGLLLLAGGSVAEKRSQYVMFSRGVIAAGWGLLYFVAFAAYHVPGARVIDSESVDLVLMLLTAAGMVIHAMRYRSETATTLAFLFAFGTVAISRETAFTVPAILVLAAASAMIAVSLRWTGLETAAIAATYINHSLWLDTLTSATSNAGEHEFLLSVALLVVYWTMFRASFVVGARQSTVDDRFASLGAVVNTLGFVIVGAQHPLDRGVEFLALVTLGAADLLLAGALRSRRVACATLVTVGATALAAAFPVYFDARVVSVAWLLESEALLVVGALSGSVLFARLGIAGSALTAVHLLGSVANLAGRRVAFELPATDPQLAFVCALASVIYYFNGIAALRQSPIAPPGDLEQALAKLLSYAGAVFLLSALWAGVPLHWLALSLVAAAVVSMVLARRFALIDLWWQSQALASIALWILLVINTGDHSTIGPVSRRLVVFLLAAAGFHLMSEQSVFSPGRFQSWCAQAHAWMRSALLMAIAWLELDSAVVVPAWALLVFVHAAVAGLTGRRQYLQLSAAGAVLVALHVILVDAYSPGRAAGSWLATPSVAVTIAAGFLLLAMPVARRMRTEAGPDTGPIERLLSGRPDRVLFFASLLMIVSVIYGQASGANITIGWGAAAGGAFLLALWMRERAFRLGAIALLLICVLRVVVVDVWQLQQQGRYIAFMALGSVLLLVSFLYSRYRTRLDDYL